LEQISHSAQQTEAIAEALARRLPPGAVLGLRGGLGAGKTAFVRGLARGMGLDDRVTSPTYALCNDYGGRLYHFDWYRLSGADELDAAGWYDALDSGASVAVEWSERAPEAFPPGTVFVTLTYLNEHERSIRIDDSRP
jgi:tRNA threonylcarbamoyladenosine biosynthesis protein TsaE